eukprot:GDKH01025036.1.p1 GENE.GDKH01025036.1~~GDKH01025036.1.p1  ORF type:complete len:103 (+),score=4.55 GDKH01025036.1:350-658(+)
MHRPPVPTFIAHFLHSVGQRQEEPPKVASFPTSRFAHGRHGCGPTGESADEDSDSTLSLLALACGSAVTWGDGSVSGWWDIVRDGKGLADNYTSSKREEKNR